MQWLLLGLTLEVMLTCYLITLAHRSSGKSLRYKNGIPKCKDSIPHTTACPRDPKLHSSPAWGHQSLPQRCWRMLVCPGCPHGCPGPLLGWWGGSQALTLCPASSQGISPGSPAPREPQALFAPWYHLSRWEVHVRSTNSNHRPLETETLSLVVYIQHSYFRPSWLPKLLLNNAERNFPPPFECQNLAAFGIRYHFFFPWMHVVYLTIHNGSYKNTLFYFSYRHLANGWSNLVRLLYFIQ